MTLAHISYRILGDDAWALINDDLRRSSAGGAYWTLRVFGLDGTVSFDLPSVCLPWGGFLLDLACALASWLDGDSPAMRWNPDEQANPIEFLPQSDDLLIRTGNREGLVSLAEARRMTADWLAEIARDISENAPGIMAVPGFEWVAAAMRREG